MTLTSSDPLSLTRPSAAPHYLSEHKDSESGGPHNHNKTRPLDESQESAQPVWRKRQPPELPTLHLFPPSPTASDTSHDATAAAAVSGESGAAVASNAVLSPPLDAASADDSLDDADSSRRSGSYRAAVPNTTLSFSCQSESLLPPDGDQRYKQTGAAIAAHHLDEQREAATAFGESSAATASCCVAGPCSARCVDDVELLAAWRELLEESEQLSHWSSEDEVAASEAHFQSAVRSLVWRGIPHSIRQRAWLRLLRDKMPSRDMSAYYSLMLDQVSRAYQQHDEQQRRQARGVSESFGPSAAGSSVWLSFADIEKDVNRTLPSLWLFRSADGVERLRRVLLAYCVHCPLVGYCQGLNFIAGSLLLVCEGDEVAAFSLLTAMVDARSGYYSKSMAACMVDTQVLTDLCGYFEPELCALLSGHGLSLSNFCSSWLICLFCNTPLNVYDTFRVWDVLHVLGDEVLFRCGLSLLRHAHSRIAAIRSSEELMLLFLQQLGDVQRIEPVMQHMYAEWRAEPLLGHSIAALREYHRYEITAEHSTLPASTVVRLSEKVTFSEDELQRLWQIFIRPDPWLTISTQCIQSLVHFRYSFCAAVFHPDTSAQFKGRGLILPLSWKTEAAASLSSTPAAATSTPPADHTHSTEPVSAADQRRSMDQEESATVAPPAGGELSDTHCGGQSPSITAFYNPNDSDTIGARQDEVRLLTEAALTSSPTTLTPTTTSALTGVAHSHPAVALSSSASSRSVCPGSSFLSQLTHVSSAAGGGGMRSLASTFVIPAPDEGSDSIFAHANSNSSRHSRQASHQRANNPPSQLQQPHASHRHVGSQLRQSPSHASPSAVDVDLSAFHAPSTSVPLSSPPMSPSSRSSRVNAAARVFAFAFSPNNSTTQQHEAALHASKKSATRAPPQGRQPRANSSGHGSRPLSPHPLPSSFSAHRALLSATTALSPPAVSEYGRLSLQRSSLSATLLSPTSSPMSAPSALYSATAAALLPLTEASELREVRQPFNSTTPLASTVRDSEPSSATLSLHTTSRVPSASSATADPPLSRPRLTRPPSSSPSPSLPASASVWSVSSAAEASAATSVYACSDNVLARLFSMLDSSSRGVVDFDEFCFGVCLFKRYPRSARLRALFAMCDVAGDGQVSRADFASFVGMFDRLYHGKRASDAELQSFVAEAFAKAAPSQYINCPLFEQIVQLHPAISKFFRLESASD